MVSWRAKWRRIKKVYFKNLDSIVTWLLFASFALWWFGKSLNIEGIMAFSAYFSLTVLAFAAGMFFQKVVITEYSVAEIKERLHGIEEKLAEVESKLVRF